MARYRVGNAYLSEHEYRVYGRSRFTFRLLVVAAALGGFGAYRVGVEHALSQAPLFTLTCSSAALFAGVAFASRDVIHAATRIVLWAVLLAAGLYTVWTLVGRG